jgi:hypothetical protein
MTLHLSEDKSAYSTLKGLVAMLQTDALNAQRAATRYSERSLDHARAKGEWSAFNQTIALIQSTDVWRHGAITEAEAKVVKHVHADYPPSSFRNPLTFTTDEEVATFLGALPATSMMDALMTYAINFRQCIEPDCKFYHRYREARGG